MSAGQAAGIPARDVYGVRVVASDEFKSLGRADDITGAQHCRADVYLNGYGWVPVDPADVRKVVLEENLPGEQLPLDDPKVKKARPSYSGLGDELAALQLRARRQAAKFQRTGDRLLHVPAIRDRQRAQRQPGSEKF
jgi:transglutaminase-like putative cysteine protease